MVDIAANEENNCNCKLRPEHTKMYFKSKANLCDDTLSRDIE